MSTHPDISIPLTPGGGYHIYNRGNEKRPIFFKPHNYDYFLDKYHEYMSGFVDTYAYCLLTNHFHLVIKVRPVSVILERAHQVGFDRVNALFLRRYVVPWFFRPDASGGGLTVLPIWKNTIVEEILPRLKELRIKELLELLNLRHGPSPNTTSITIHPDHLEELDPYHQLATYIIIERFRRFLLAYAKAINLQEGRTGSLFQKTFRRKWIASSDDARRAITYVHHNPIHHGICDHYDQYHYSSYSSITECKSTITSREQILDLFDGLSSFLAYIKRYRQYRWEKEKFYIEDVKV
jgi:REP element-mobilizing transposase RayT